MAVITLLSDFVDGTSMALVEDTELGNLNDYMTQSQGKLWAGVQQRRRKQGLTTIRRGTGNHLLRTRRDGERCSGAVLAECNGVARRENSVFSHDKGRRLDRSSCGG
jgi:hypothetical protein